MMRNLGQAGLLGLSLVLLTTGTATAEQGRFTMSPTEGGFVRLDSATGAMSFCKKGTGDTWDCSDMPDTAEAGRKRLEQLEAENKALKDDVKRYEETFGLAEGGPGAGAPKSFTIPDEKDVDKAFDYMEGMIKKFRERMKKLEEQQGSEGGTPL